MENLPFFEEMEEFIGKSFLSRGGRVSDSLSVYLPLQFAQKLNIIALYVFRMKKLIGEG